MRLIELFEQVPKSVEKEVRATKLEFEQTLKAILFDEIRLSITPKTDKEKSLVEKEKYFQQDQKAEWENRNRVYSISLRTYIEGAQKTGFEEFQIPDELREAALLSLIKPSIYNLISSTEEILDCAEQNRLGSVHLDLLDRANSQGLNLLNLTKQFNIIADLYRKFATLVNGDLLGSFRFNDFARSPLGVIIKTEIRLFWQVIGYIAANLNISVKGLTLVTFAHELAHAYTLAGLDADQKGWFPELALESDITFVESLAEYYTLQVAMRLKERVPEMLEAFEAQAKEMPKHYKAYQIWVDEQVEKETIRSMFIQCRRREYPIDFKEFTDKMFHLQERR